VRITWLISVALTGLAAALLVGCGGDESGDPKTVTRTVETTPSAPEGAGSQGDETGGSLGGGGGGGGKIRLPNLVGEDHQLAQDTLQAKGLYSLDERDATGQDRLLLWDRNWTVVRTDPPAGTRVSPDDTITLYSKKDGE
jgi:hypothetical protein